MDEEEEDVFSNFTTGETEGGSEMEMEGYSPWIYSSGRSATGPE